MTLKIGDRVEKWTGDYNMTGEVRAVYTTRRGELRYVVEPDLIPLQLIYSPHQLRGINNDVPPKWETPTSPASPEPMSAKEYVAYTNARGETSKPMALSEEERQDRAELCTISINGHVHTLRVGAVISYADACTIAHRPSDSTVIWSILDGPRGKMMPGDSVIADNGLRISVVQTGAA